MGLNGQHMFWNKSNEKGLDVHALKTTAPRFLRSTFSHAKRVIWSAAAKRSEPPLWASNVSKTVRHIMRFARNFRAENSL